LGGPVGAARTHLAWICKSAQMRLQMAQPPWTRVVHAAPCLSRFFILVQLAEGHAALRQAAACWRSCMCSWIDLGVHRGFSCIEAQFGRRIKQRGATAVFSREPFQRRSTAPKSNACTGAPAVGVLTPGRRRPRAPSTPAPSTVGTGPSTPPLLADLRGKRRPGQRKGPFRKTPGQRGSRFPKSRDGAIDLAQSCGRPLRCGSHAFSRAPPNGPGETALEKRPLSKGRMPSATAAFKSATRARRPKMLPATAETAVAGLAIRAL